MPIVENGVSLFNPGEIINLNADDHGREEHEDDIQERKRKEKELQELLQTEFDDLIEDDESVISSCPSDEGQQSFRKRKVFHFPNVKANETSTPKTHILPNWTANYTPINGQQMPYRLLSTKNKENGLEHVSEENINNSFSNDFDNRPSQVSNGVNHHAHQNGKVNEEGAFQHQEYAQNLVTLKETMLKQQEEHSREIRLLKHQLTLSKGEKEGLVFSLQQARQLLNDKEQQVYDYLKNIEKLEKELAKEKDTNDKLANQIQLSQSSIDSLKNQISELNQFENLSHIRAKNENTLKLVESRYQQEISQAQKELKEKDYLIQKLKSQVEELERYQENTLPDKLRGINQLTRCLESVENHCQKLLSTEALKDAEYFTVEQNQQDAREKEHKDQINLLLNAVNELGLKLSHNSESVPLEVHTKNIQRVEEEKIVLQKKYDILSQEISRLEHDKRQLSDHNAKLNATMETMIKKHDLDIKSAIEKYHSLHSKDTKKLQSELDEVASQEKAKLRDFYEGKLAIVYEEMDRLKTRLDEAQDLYVKICHEKSQLETKLESNQAEIQLELNKAYKKMEEDLRERFTAEFEAKFSGNQNQNQNHSSANKEHLKSELESVKQQLRSLQNYKESAEKKIKDYEEENAEFRSTINFLQNKLANSETEFTELQDHLVKVQDLFNQHITDQNNEFNRRLKVIEQTQKDEIEKLIAECDKMSQKETETITKRANDVIEKLKGIIRELEAEIISLKKDLHKNKSDFSCMVSLDTAKETLLMEEVTKCTRYIRHLEKEMKLQGNISRDTTSTQTDVEMVEKKDLYELNQMYKELVLNLHDRLECFCKSTSENYASRLKKSIIDYHKNMKN